MVVGLQVLREFNHVNPQDDDEGKEFVNTRVSVFILSIEERKGAAVWFLRHMLVWNIFYSSSATLAT